MINIKQVAQLFVCYDKNALIYTFSTSLQGFNLNTIKKHHLKDTHQSC